MSDESFYRRIYLATSYYLTRYPKANLQDIYKGFFQDEFGPGHLLDDIDASRKFLLREISEMKVSGRHLVEPCGAGDNFFRVNLDMVVDGIISFDHFFEIFSESGAMFRLPEAEPWMKKWTEIEKAIRPLKKRIYSYDEGVEMINDLFDARKVVAHHSNKFIELYQPHYRIICRRFVEKYFSEFKDHWENG